MLTRIRLSSVPKRSYQMIPDMPGMMRMDVKIVKITENVFNGSALIATE